MMFSPTVFAQSQSGPIYEYKFGIKGARIDEAVTHTLTAQGTAWEKMYGQYYISSDPLIYQNSITTVGNSDLSSPNNWPGFTRKWRNSNYTYWGMSLYKVTNSCEGIYYYMDSRDSDYGDGAYPVVQYSLYDAEHNNHKVSNSSILHPDEWPVVGNREVVRVWELHSSIPDQSMINSLWYNALVDITHYSGNSNPRIAWLPYPNFPADGYRVYRSITTTGNPPGNWSLVATTSSTVYEYTDWSWTIDMTNPANTAHYKVVAYNSSQTSPATNILSIGIGMPAKKPSEEVIEQVTEYSLDQNYPNPFNPQTVIPFSLKKDTRVKLSVFDVTGKEVAVLVDGMLESGRHDVNFNASDLPSGIYFYSIVTSDFTANKKMILMK